MSSFLLELIISETWYVWEDPSPPLRARGVCDISTSWAFLRNWLVPRSSSVAFRLLFSRGFVFGQAIGIVTCHLLSRWLTLPCYIGMGDLVFRPFVARIALCTFWLWVFMGPSLSSTQARRSLLSSVFCFVLLGLLLAGCCDFLSLLCIWKSL